MAAETRPDVKEQIAKKHSDFRVSHSYAGSSITVACVCGDWRRTLASGHTLTDLLNFLGQHQEAELELAEIQARKEELW